MVLLPSNFQPPKDEGFHIEQVERGLFVVSNAYDGQYEYFENRPIPVDTDDRPSERAIEQRASIGDATS